MRVSGAADDEVVGFLARHRLFRHFRRALRLAEVTFNPVHPLQVEVEVDPETGAGRVVVDMAVDLPVNEVLKRDDAFVRRWIATAAAEARGRVRVLYHVL